MSGRDHYHLLRPQNDFLVVLADVSLWTDLHFGDIGVLVQDMEVVVGRNAVDALPLVIFLGSIHSFRFCNLQNISLTAEIKESAYPDVELTGENCKPFLSAQSLC